MEEIWRQYPYLQIIWDALRVVAPLASLLAYAGLVFISATAKILSIVKKRSAFDKCSRQIALLALILGWALLIGGRVWLYVNPHVSGSPENFLLEMSWLLLSLGVLFTTIYYTFWRILKNMPVLHSTLGMISGAQNCMALALILFTIRVCAGIAVINQDASKLPDLFPNVWNDPVWTAATYTLPLVFAMAGAFAACWLAARRKADDFGRDYYNLMLPWCVKWARNSWAILWILFLAASSMQLWPFFAQGNFIQEEIIIEGCRALLWLIPLLLWIGAAKSKVPMRHKWSMFIALLCAISFVLPYYLDITLI